MNAQQIRQGLENGKLHPFPLLQHLSREGDEDGARLVAQIGPEYVEGKERLRFRSLVREIAPEALEAEVSEMAARAVRKRQEHTSALADFLKNMNAAERERRERSLPTGGGWQLPPPV